MGGSTSPVSPSPLLSYPPESSVEPFDLQEVVERAEDMDAPPAEEKGGVGDISFVGQASVEPFAAVEDAPASLCFGAEDADTAGIIEPGDVDYVGKTEGISFDAHEEGSGQLSDDDGDRSGAEDDYVKITNSGNRAGEEAPQRRSPSASSRSGSSSGSQNRRGRRSSASHHQSGSFSSFLKRAPSLSLDKSRRVGDPQGNNGSPRGHASDTSSSDSSGRSPSIALNEGGGDALAERVHSQGWRRCPPRRLLAQRDSGLHRALPRTRRSGSMLWCTLLVLFAVLCAVVVAHVAACYRLPMGPLAALRAYVGAHQGELGGFPSMGGGRGSPGGAVGAGPMVEKEGGKGYLMPNGARGLPGAGAEQPESVLNTLPLFRAAFCLTGATSEEVAEAFLRAARGDMAGGSKAGGIVGNGAGNHQGKKPAESGESVYRGGSEEQGRAAYGHVGIGEGATNSRRSLLPYAVARELLGDAVLSARLAAQSHEEENLVLADDDYDDDDVVDDDDDDEWLYRRDLDAYAGLAGAKGRVAASGDRGVKTDAENGGKAASGAGGKGTSEESGVGGDGQESCSVDKGGAPCGSGRSDSRWDRAGRLRGGGYANGDIHLGMGGRESRVPGSGRRREGDRAYWYAAFWHTERAEGSGADGSNYGSKFGNGYPYGGKGMGGGDGDDSAGGGGRSVGASSFSGSLAPLHARGSLADALLRRVYAVPEALLPGLPSVSTCVAVAGVEVSSRRHLSDWETTTTRRLVSWGESAPISRTPSLSTAPSAAAQQQWGGGEASAEGGGLSQGDEGVQRRVAMDHGCGDEQQDAGENVFGDGDQPLPSRLDTLAMFPSHARDAMRVLLCKLRAAAQAVERAPPLSDWSPASLWSAARASAGKAAESVSGAARWFYSGDAGSYFYSPSSSPTPRFVDVVKRRPLFKRHVGGEGDLARARARMRAAVVGAGAEYLARRDAAEQRDRAAPGGCCQ